MSVTDTQLKKFVVQMNLAPSNGDVNCFSCQDIDSLVKYLAYAYGREYFSVHYDIHNSRQNLPPGFLASLPPIEETYDADLSVDSVVDNATQQEAIPVVLPARTRRRKVLASENTDNPVTAFLSGK
jgi:hypothetical protein